MRFLAITAAALVAMAAPAYADDQTMFTDYLTTETSRVLPAGQNRVDVGLQGTTLAPSNLGPNAYAVYLRGIGQGELSVGLNLAYDNLSTATPASTLEAGVIGWKQALGGFGPGRAAVLGRAGFSLMQAGTGGGPSGAAMLALPYDLGWEKTFFTIEPHVRYQSNALQPVTPGVLLGGTWAPIDPLSLEIELNFEQDAFMNTVTNAPTGYLGMGGALGASWRFNPSWSADLNLGVGTNDIGHFDSVYGLKVRYAWGSVAAL